MVVIACKRDLASSPPEVLIVVVVVCLAPFPLHLYIAAAAVVR